MPSPCGRYWIVFNGEVYNHLDLRAQLSSAIHYRGHSDTETLLHAIAEWGLEATIRRCIGMFAIGLWDQQERTLSLVRDRLGIKPLYYGRAGSSLVFGSELKSLLPHPDFQAQIDRNVLPLYLRYSYIPFPYTIYRDVYKLPPGAILTVRSVDSIDALPAPKPFWSFRDVAQTGQQHQFSGTFSEATDELERLLSDAIQLRMLADVPLGAFLSGGIDSSTVVALMQKLSTRPVKTFTIGFSEAEFNEAHFARDVAKHLGTEHTEQFVSPADAREVIPKLPHFYDEPFADVSQIPTYLVSQLARRHVTVSLSGDGGDELFCGYRRYFDANEYDWLRTRVPAPLRSLGKWGCTLAAGVTTGRMADRFRRISNLLGDSAAESRYIRNMTHWADDLGAVRDANPPPCLLSTPETWPVFPNEQSRWMFADTLTYLPEDILTKVDRASMAVSLEARVPIIDHRVVEFAWSLPHSYKYDGTISKKILRAVLERHVPQSLFDRPKTGFGVPIGQWLRGPLREWGEALLSESRLVQEGWFNARVVRRRWLEHQRGHVNWEFSLWDVLMFQAWLEHQHAGARC